MPTMSTNAAFQNSSPKRTTEEADAIRVALVDDDELFREALGMNLQDEGYDVVSFSGGEAALEYFRSDDGVADIILLDWRMPNLDGIEVLRRLRDEGNEVPVIFLTVLSDQIYEESALAGGAIDYVEKSRSFSILLKRMQLITGGQKGPTAEEAGGATADTMSFGPLELHLAACRATWQGRQVDLTLTEFKIVRVMASRAGEDLSYREIYDLARGAGFIAGYGAAGFRANVRAFIKRIRQKFRAEDQKFDMIENYPGFGYRWKREGE
ncbi:MAG: response regulator transcription factor [Inquilinus sp.]|nr:response regulator transcription factor [Inquilinus sp.]